MSKVNIGHDPSKYKPALNSLSPERCGKNFTSVFLAATKPLYEWFSPSVCLSVRLSVCLSVCPSVTPFWLCSHHCIIMKFSGLITNDRSDVHAKGQDQRSKVKFTKVNTQLCCFRTVTPVWIHRWWWNDAHSLILLRRGALLFLAATKQLNDWFSPSVCLSVCHTFLTMFPSSYHHEIFRSCYQWQMWRPCKKSRSKVKVTEVTTQLNRFWTVTPVWIHIWWWNYTYSLMLLRKGALLFFKVIRQISRSHGTKNCRIWPRLGVSGL